MRKQTPKVDAEFVDTPRRRAHHRIRRHASRGIDTWQLYSFLDGLAHVTVKQLSQVRELLRKIVADQSVWDTLETARQHEHDRDATIQLLRAVYAKLGKERA